METSPETKPTHRRNGGLIAGIILILIGLAALLQTWFDLDRYLVLLLGAAFLAWGSSVRRTGLLIPGGVLTGIGLGVLANQYGWILPGADASGVFLVCFALGWVLITLFSALFTFPQWWALIPGGIMAAVGIALIATHGNMRWQDLNLLYAALLIAGGLALVSSQIRRRKDS
jgi:hypothetical protein